MSRIKYRTASLINKRLLVLLAGVFCSQWVLAQELIFSECIAGLQDRARQEGLSTWVVDEVLPDLKPQARVIELDRSQPEFRETFATYLNRRLTTQRIDRGKDLRGELQSYLSELTTAYGVPGHYLLAFWGLETNFGSYLGKMPILDSLATLACDERRSKYFSSELITALTLLQRESLKPEQMLGSWAGAMGHTQFMPSAYSKYAVDGDKDGQVNLWRSEKDALASGANFLQHLGWQTGERWGREVILPKGFPYEKTGLKNKQPMKYWRDLGVKLTSRGVLPNVDLQGSILVPAGHAGPAFLVYQNFHVIMRWNRSESYALSVGLLADRIAGAAGLAHPPLAEEAPLSRSAIETMQMVLNRLGFEAGEADGVLGPATRSALRAFESSSGFIADGYPDSEILSVLEAKAKPSS